MYRILLKRLKKAESMTGKPLLTYILLKYIIPLVGLVQGKGLKSSLGKLGLDVKTPTDIKILSNDIRMLIENFEGLISSVEKSEPIVWAEWSVTWELIRSFGVQPVCPERAILFGLGVNKNYGIKFLEESEKMGYSNETCSCQKGAIGAYMLGQLPQPALLVASSHPCDSGVSIYQTLQYLTGAPLYVLDTPYWRTESDLKYHAGVFRGLIEFCEDHLGRKFDWDRFTAAIEEMNRANYYLRETCEMGRAVPLPYYIRKLDAMWFSQKESPGTSLATQNAKMIYDKAKKNFDKGKGVAKKEKIRVIWWDVPVGFADISSWMTEQYGAVVIADYIGLHLMDQIDTSSRESILEGVARAHIYHGMTRQCHGPAEFVTAELETLINEYSPDCFMFSRHVGCKHNWAIGKIIRDVCRRTGLPSLFLTTDIFDPRLASRQQIKQEISEFFKAEGLA